MVSSKPNNNIPYNEFKMIDLNDCAIVNQRTAGAITLISPNKHLCLDCGLKYNLYLNTSKSNYKFPSTNKCQLCKKSKLGTTVKRMSICGDKEDIVIPCPYCDKEIEKVAKRECGSFILNCFADSCSKRASFRVNKTRKAVIYYAIKRDKIRKKGK